MESLGALRKELDAAVSSHDEELSLDVLGRLGADGLIISKELVAGSGLGTVLGQLSKNAWSEVVKKRAEEVKKSWITRLKNDKNKEAKAFAAPSPPPAAAASGGEGMRQPTRTFSSVSEPALVKNITGVRKRDVIIAKLAGILRGVLDEVPDLGLTEEATEKKAIDIEAALERQLSGNPHEHKTKYLQLVRNLRDEGNSQLRLRVALGHLAPEDLVTLSAADLAPEDVQREIQDMDAYNKEASKMRKPTAQMTTQFGACGKCRSTKISYFMMQTRSADEPMTIFISCTTCGHSWRK